MFSRDVLLTKKEANFRKVNYFTDGLFATCYHCRRLAIGECFVDAEAEQSNQTTCDYFKINLEEA